MRSLERIVALLAWCSSVCLSVWDGRALWSYVTWDVTVVHTLAASYVSQSAVQAGSAATAASVRKSAKYSSLSSSHVFCPVAVETPGPLADDAQLFLTGQESNASHSRSAGRHVSILADFCGNSAFQCRMSDQLVNCFWVPIVTIPDRSTLC